MFSFNNRTVFNISSTWDRTRFQVIHSKYRRARKLIERSINIQYEKQLKNLHQTNNNIEKNLIEMNEELLKYERKIYIFDNLTDIASESLSIFFDKRMKKIQTITEKYCNDIQTVLQDENQYWKDIQSALDQKLITSEFLADNFSEKENLITTTKQECVSVAKLNDTTNRLSSNEISVIYSKPNPPAQLCFSPTILHDEQSDSISDAVSPMDQDETYFMDAKVVIQRIDHSFVLDYLKREELLLKSRIHSTIKTESKSISRKRKQSILEESNSIVLRKRKSVSIIEIQDKKPRKRRNKKINNKQIPIRSSSLLPNIDQSKQHRTRPSTRSQPSDTFEQSKSYRRTRKKRR